MVAGMGVGSQTAGGATKTGAETATVGTGSGIPRLIPKCTPAFTVVSPTTARANIAIVFFITIKFDAAAEQDIITRELPFCNHSLEILNATQGRSAATVGDWPYIFASIFLP
jgi:hypothetical protein